MANGLSDELTLDDSGRRAAGALPDETGGELVGEIVVGLGVNGVVLGTPGAASGFALVNGAELTPGALPGDSVGINAVTPGDVGGDDVAPAVAALSGAIGTGTSDVPNSSFAIVCICETNPAMLAKSGLRPEA